MDQLKVIKSASVVKKKDDTEKFIASHELSLLSLLVAKHPERAKEFLRRLNESMKEMKVAA